MKKMRFERDTAHSHSAQCSPAECPLSMQQPISSCCPASFKHIKVSPLKWLILLTTIIGKQSCTCSMCNSQSFVKHAHVVGSTMSCGSATSKPKSRAVSQSSICLSSSNSGTDGASASQTCVSKHGDCAQVRSSQLKFLTEPPTKASVSPQSRQRARRRLVRVWSS